MIWTAERNDQIKALWAAGLSCSQIAAAMGGGITRNAVIGRVHRLSLPKRASPIGAMRSQKSAADKAAAPRKSKPVSLASGQPRGAPIVPALRPPIPEPPSAAGHVPLLALTGHTCRWVVGGAGASALFCGARPKPERPYCEHHCRIGYLPLERRRDKQRPSLALELPARAA